VITTSRGPERADLAIAFHGIGTPPPWVDDAERRYWCDEARYVELLDALLVRATASGRRLAITFDDGNQSDIERALPPLLARGACGEFFVCTARIGTAGYLSAESLRALHAAGMVIGSHGARHVDWTTCDDATLAAEVHAPLAQLGELLGCVVDRIAIPFGAYDRRVVGELRRSAARVVYSSDEDLPQATALLTPRFSVTDDWTVAHVEAMFGRRAFSLATARRRAIQWLKRTLPARAR
jgi:peptidoglycan/xylan/chitin deacetylase (PgdA/CDA1 family)